MKRSALALLVSFLIMPFIGYAWLSRVRVSHGYSVQAEFSWAPPNDTRLEAWLKEQPGVVTHTVRIERSSSEQTGAIIVKMSFIQSRNLKGYPQLPALDQECHDLGYLRGSKTFQPQGYR